MAMGYIVLGTNKSEVKWQPYTDVCDSPEAAQEAALAVASSLPSTGTTTFVVADVTSIRNINAALAQHTPSEA